MNSHTRRPRLTFSERCDEALFRALSSRNLIYNTCWEDPAVDREALHLTSEDVVLTIASAGCNALDYLLEAPKQVIAVDINPRQSALVELKAAAIRALPYDDIFAMFGRGRHPRATELYRESLRSQLSPFAAAYWDRRIPWFSSAGPFYRHGLSGVFARFFRHWMSLNSALGHGVREMFERRDLAAQREHYHARVRPHLWTAPVRWALSRQATLSVLGVPMPQRQLVQAQYPGGVPRFIEHSIDRLFSSIPAWSNYFYRLYAIGEYTEECCPRYLSRDGVAALKGGLIDRLEIHACSVTEYLERPGCPAISRFVLLDHMDWMSSYYPDLLAEEWNAIHARMTPNGRVLFRSAHQAPPYLDTVRVGPAQIPLREWLSFQDEEARHLSLRDRVHTYASFHVGHTTAAMAGLSVPARRVAVAG